MTTATADQLAHDARKFLRFKRAMGLPYWRAEFILNEFVRSVWWLWSDGDAVYLIRPRPAIRQIASMRPLRTATISSCRCTVVSE